MNTFQHLNDLKEKAKLDGEKMLSMHFDSSTEVVAIFDTELNYLYANPAATDLLNKKVQELEGNNLLEVFPQLIASVSHRQLLKAISGKAILGVSSEGNVTKQGARFATNYYPLLHQGRVYAVVAVTKKIYFP